MAMVMMEAIYKLKYFIVCPLKTWGKWQERRENTGNLVLIGHPDCTWIGIENVKFTLSQMQNKCLAVQYVAMF